MHALFEVGYNFGWRIGELTNLRVRQIDLASRTVSLDPFTTKNDEPRIAVMTGLVYALLQQCVAGKASRRVRLHATERQTDWGFSWNMVEGLQRSWSRRATLP
jgi:integrase